MIMPDALEEYDGKVSISDRYITNLRFADDTNALVVEEQDIKALVESFDETCIRYKMDDKQRQCIQKEIKVKGRSPSYNNDTFDALVEPQSFTIQARILI